MTNPNGRPLSTWNKTQTPAAATNAAVTQSGVANVRHVIRGISAIFSTGAAAQSTPIVLSITDGGSVIWSQQFIAPANTVVIIQRSDLDLVCGIGTDVTIAFSGTPAAGSYSSVSQAGFDLAQETY